jgi:hypothetical protein
MVTAEFRMHHLDERTIILIIRNYGPSVARNVSVTFDPPLPDSGSSMPSNSLGPFLKARYGRKIPVLVPGAEMDNIYFTPVGGNDGKGWQNREGLPDQVTVTIGYDATDGAHYEDGYPLDIGAFRDRTYIARSDRDPSERLKVIGEHLKEIKQSLRTMSRTRPPGDSERS